MINYAKIAIPITAVLIVGGLVSFFIVYSLYPEKHENIKIDDKCYELTGPAHNAFINLTSHIEKNSLLLQLSKVKDPNAIVPIRFNGERSAVEDFINNYNVIVNSIQNVTLYPKTIGSIVNGNVSTTTLSGIVTNLSLAELSAASKSIEGTISIIPNEHITDQEIQDISIVKDKLMQNGLRNIIATQDGVSPAECRYR